MANLKMYIYNKCGTCNKAVKYLKEKGIEYDTLPIRETPPTKEELEIMLSSLGGEIKKLFNTSGGDYREMKIKDKISTITKEEAFELLMNNGNLVKRPFVINGNKGWVGFKENEWDNLL